MNKANASKLTTVYVASLINTFTIFFYQYQDLNIYFFNREQAIRSVRARRFATLLKRNGEVVRRTEQRGQPPLPVPRVLREQIC